MAAPAAVAGDSRRRRRAWLVPVGGAAGLALLVYLIAELGPSRIAAQLQGLWTILPVVLLITFLKYPLQTAGWRLVLPPAERPRWPESLAATISGDALGYLMWAGPFAGEPMRALLVRDSVRVAQGTAAGAMERAIYNLTAAVLVWTVLFVLVSATHTLALVAAAAGTAVTLVVAGLRLRRGMRAHRSPGPPGPGRQEVVPEKRGGRAVAFFEAARDLWRQRRGVLPAVVLLCFAQHAVLLTEAYLILGALSGGTTLTTALVFEAVTKIVNTIGLVVPGRLGVAEGGSALLADALGFAASHGLSLALMRRIRSLTWAGLGLALLPFQEARARRRR